jgi:hypothetical protein
VYPALSILWTIEHNWFQAQTTLTAGASHHPLDAVSPTAAGRTRVCNVINTGIGRRVRCSVTVSAGPWAITAQPESASGIITQSVNTVSISGEEIPGRAAAPVAATLAQVLATGADLT